MNKKQLTIAWFKRVYENKSSKKIIAKEVLVLLGIALIAIILAATEPLAITSDYLFYFSSLCITYAIIRFIFIGIRKFNLKITWFDKSGIIASGFSFLLMHFGFRVDYIIEPYSKFIKAIITIFILYVLVFVLILLIRLIIWAIKTLKEK